MLRSINNTILILLLCTLLTSCEEADVETTTDDNTKDYINDSIDGLLEDEPTINTDVNLLYQKSNEIFANPERGFMTYIPAFKDYVSKVMLERRKNNKVTVVHIGYKLGDFLNSDISQDYIDKITLSLDRVRKAGAKVVIRFQYNSSVDGFDASESQILKHIEQLKQVLNNNSDVIAAIEAGFIGAWGEWHGSSSGLDNDSSRKNVLDKLLASVPKNRMVMLRNNGHKRAIYGAKPLAIGEAFSESNKSRTGAHNDCVGASFNDYYTYQPDSIESEKDYLNRDNLYVPQAGETCHVALPYSGCDNLVSDFKRMRWDLLSESFNKDVLKGLVEGGCMDEVKRNLGYRFQLTSAKMETIISNGMFSAQLKLKNVGWGKAFNPRVVEIILRQEGEIKEYVIPLSDDPRMWSPSDTKEYIISISEKLPANIPDGAYKVFLNLPDPEKRLYSRPEYSIRLANMGLWEKSTGFNSLNHTVQIQQH